jgi:hypothetical protein
MGFVPVRSAGWQPAVTCGLGLQTGLLGCLVKQRRYLPNSSYTYSMPAVHVLEAFVSHICCSYMLLVCALSEQFCLCIHVAHFNEVTRFYISHESIISSHY